MIPHLSGVLTITYARSRLWLGISGVGTVVVISIWLLSSGLPLELLPNSRFWSPDDLVGLLASIACLVGVLLPLDVLGGLLLPNRSRPNSITAGSFVLGWLRGVLSQSSLFLLTSVWILSMGRWFGLPGATSAVIVVGILLVVLQGKVAMIVGRLRNTGDHDSDSQSKIAEALQRTSQWGWELRSVVVMKHHDTGFTGGIVGFPGRETIVVPASSLVELKPDELAVTIARRLEAAQNGSRTRGILVALTWVGVGFVLSGLVPGAGVTSVAELAMTCLGFTLWTFLGLLTLPTLSRQASYAIDRKVIEQGAPAKVLNAAVTKLDRLQDDEPRRSTLVETIFHPVPSVDNRCDESTSTFPIAWHAARMTLFLSWACMGMLVRAVHCNAGRPELWVLLPTD